MAGAKVLKVILEELATRAKAGDALAMDYASRMQRAKEQGFDVDKTWYHGTQNEFSGFKKSKLGSATGAPSAKQGYFFTDKPNVASDYSEIGEGRGIDALREKSDIWEKIAKRSGKPADWDKYHEMQQQYEDAALGAFDEFGGIVEGSNVIPSYLRSGKEKTIDFKGEAYREDSYNDILKTAKSEGYDSVLLKNTIDPASPNDRTIQDIRVVTDPKNIRSVNAAFDPAKRESSNLLASAAPAALGLGALAGGEDAEAGGLGKGMARALDKSFPITHGSSESVDEIRKEGLFHGIFGSAGNVSEHGGEIQNTFYPRKGKVAGSGDVDIDYDDAMTFLKEEYPDADESTLAGLYEMVAEDKNVFDMATNPLANYGYDDLGEASWEGQRLRGKLAQRQDFDAIAMSDEFGTSYLLPSGTKAKKAGLGALGAGTTAALFTPEQNKAMSAQLVDMGIEDVGSITADEFPFLQQAGDFIEKWTQTPIGSPAEGLAEYLKGFGQDDDTQAKATRAFWAAMDIMP